MRVSGAGVGETWNRVQAQAGAQMEIVNEKQGRGFKHNVNKSRENITASANLSQH